MRILIVGAGGIGGYFGGRLLEAGCDVTFLLRPRRAAQIASTGLVLTSPHGDVTFATPPRVSSDEIAAPFDLVLVACKSYDLDATIDAIAHGVGPQTAILPLLNGMRHLDKLAARFGAKSVLGGHCMISAALDDAGTIRHLSELHRLTFGELDGERSVRVVAIETEFARAKFDTIASSTILHEMWEKWVFIASLGGINSLMRASVGDIVAAGASDLSLALYEECSAIGRANGFPPRDAAREHATSILTMAGSAITASLYKDIEAGSRTEGEHIVGDLIARGTSVQPQSLLRIVYAHLTAYEIGRAP